MDLNKISAESLLRAELAHVQKLLLATRQAHLAAMAQLVVANRFVAAVATACDQDGSGVVLVGQEHLDAARARCLFRFRIDPVSTPEGKHGLQLTLADRPTAEDLQAVDEVERQAAAGIKIEVA